MGSIALILPCWQRRELTKRAIKAIAGQTRADFQLFLIGDGCPEFESLVTTDSEVQSWLAHLKARGCDVVMGNSRQHHGSPAPILDWAIRQTNRDFVCFTANDDLLLPGHIENYSTATEALTYFDLLWFSDVWCDVVPGPTRWHGSSVIKTEVARLYTHDKDWGHDCRLMHKVEQHGFEYKAGAPITYLAYDSGGFNSRMWRDGPSSVG